MSARWPVDHDPLVPAECHPRNPVKPAAGDDTFGQLDDRPLSFAEYGSVQRGALLQRRLGQRRRVRAAQHDHRLRRPLFDGGGQCEGLIGLCRGRRDAEEPRAQAGDPIGDHGVVELIDFCIDHCHIVARFSKHGCKVQQAHGLDRSLRQPLRLDEHHVDGDRGHHLLPRRPGALRRPERLSRSAAAAGPVVMVRRRHPLSPSAPIPSRRRRTIGGRGQSG